MFKIKKEHRDLATVPAQLVGSVEQAAAVARKNLSWLVAGVALAVVAALAVGGFLWVRQQEDQAATELLREGTQIVSARPMGAMPVPRRESEETKKAVELFRQVLAEFPRSSVAPQAAYLLGNALSDLEEWDGAVSAYQDFLSRYGEHRSLVPLVSMRLGYAHLSQGKVEEAEKAFSAIVKMHGALNKDQALFELAKIDERLNRPEGALARYQEIMKDHPQSPFATEASVRIKTLDARKAAEQ